VETFGNEESGAFDGLRRCKDEAAVDFSLKNKDLERLTECNIGWQVCRRQFNCNLAESNPQNFPQRN
jgi:hypothetical protein